MNLDGKAVSGKREAELRPVAGGVAERSFPDAFPRGIWRFICVVAFAVCLSIPRGPASAQAPADDPFAGPPLDAPADAAGAPAADADADADATDAEPQPIDLSQYGPAVQAVLERERTTSEDLLEGVLLLVELGEPELAEPWLEQLAQNPPDTETQAQLAREFGSHRLMRLASAEALGQPARDLASSLMEAYAAAVRDPQRLSNLIDQLADPSADARYVAVAGLVEGGQAAAAALVAALDNVKGDDHRTWLHVAITELAPASVGPLLAGLEADEASVRAQSALLLGRLAPSHLASRLLAPALADDAPQVRGAASQALQRMLGRVPTPEAAEQILSQAVEQHLESTLPLAVNDEGQVELWYWDQENARPAPMQLEPRRAHLFIASQLAGDLVQLVPTKRQYLEQDLMLQLATGEIGDPRSGRLPGVNTDRAQQILLAALQRALRRNLPRAIAGAARELAKMPQADAVLLSHAPAESPLVRALSYPSEAVRWEALAAIMELDFGQPYPGASRVTRALADFVQSGVRPRAVVALPTVEKAQNVAADVDRLGYKVTLATTGREAILAAAESGGADLVLLDARLGHPSLREVLYQMRANPRSSGAAIGVLALGERLQRARDVAEAHRDVRVFPYPVEEGAVAAIVETLEPPDGGSGIPDVPPREERVRQALAWMGQLLARRDPLYDVRQYAPAILQAVNEPPLTETAVEVLAHLGTHESQRRLVELASSRTAPIDLREKAAEALRTSARQHGLQLTTGEILRQYDRYNASETADRATQIVLGHVLDTIEMKRMQTAGE